MSLDDLWQEFDVDQNGFLDKSEARPYLDEVAKIIQQDRAQCYDRTKFEEYFVEFDEDKNGFLSKNEMSQFIKLVFRQMESEASLKSPGRSSGAGSPGRKSGKF